MLGKSWREKKCSGLILLKIVERDKGDVPVVTESAQHLGLKI